MEVLHKGVPTDMAPVFSVLGVTVDLTSCRSGIVVIRNKESRVTQIKHEISEIIRSKLLPPAVASSLRGRLQFAESQSFGRAINLFIETRNARATSSHPGNTVDENILAELRWAQNFIEDDRPRILKVDQSRAKVVIFTDACLEDNDTNAGVGMVAFVCKDGCAARSTSSPKRSLVKCSADCKRTLLR